MNEKYKKILELAETIPELKESEEVEILKTIVESDFVDSEIEINTETERAIGSLTTREKAILSLREKYNIVKKGLLTKLDEHSLHTRSLSDKEFIELCGQLYGTEEKIECFDILLSISINKRFNAKNDIEGDYIDVRQGFKVVEVFSQEEKNDEPINLFRVH